MGSPVSDTIEGLVASSAGVSSPLVIISGGSLGMIGGGTFANKVTDK